MKEIRWLCLVHDHACCWEIFRLSIKPSAISRYHSKPSGRVGTNLNISHLGDIHHMEAIWKPWSVHKFPLSKADKIRWWKPQVLTLESFLGQNLYHLDSILGVSTLFFMRVIPLYPSYSFHPCIWNLVLWFKHPYYASLCDHKPWLFSCLKP
jgi:hypothetical protein